MTPGALVGVPPGEPPSSARRLRLRVTRQSYTNYCSAVPYADSLPRFMTSRATHMPTSPPDMSMSTSVGMPARSGTKS